MAPRVGAAARRHLRRARGPRRRSSSRARPLRGACGARDRPVRLDELRLPVARHREAVADLREREEPRGAGRGHEGARRRGIAHLVDLALKHHPGHRQAGEGGQVVADALDLLLEGEAALPARRVVDLEVRTEAEADRPGERLRRRGGQRRVDERRARRVADQDRALVRREACGGAGPRATAPRGRPPGRRSSSTPPGSSGTRGCRCRRRARPRSRTRSAIETTPRFQPPSPETNSTTCVGRARRRVERDLAERGQGERLGGLAGEARARRRGPGRDAVCREDGRLISGRSCR